MNPMGIAVPTADTVKSIAAEIRDILLPIQSAELPPRHTPIKIPMVALLIANPFIELTNSTNSSGKRMALDIITRSYPQMNPPAAATKATQGTYAEHLVIWDGSA
jgi:hypothetical protein